MADEDLKTIVSALLDEVRLLTVQTKVQALKKFYDEFLTTDFRRSAYEKFDGSRTLQEVNDELSGKINTLQVFVQILVEKDLVDFYFKGNSRVIRKSLSKIATYYANKELEGT